MLRRHLGTCRAIHVLRNGGFQQIFGKERKPDGSQVSKRGPGAAFPSMSARSRAQLWIKQQASLLCKVSVPNPYGCRKPGAVLKPLVPCFCRKRFSSVRLSVYVFRLQIQWLSAFAKQCLKAVGSRPRQESIGDHSVTQGLFGLGCAHEPLLIKRLAAWKPCTYMPL